MVARSLKVVKADHTAPPEWDDFYVVDQDGRVLTPEMSRERATVICDVLQVVAADTLTLAHALAALQAAMGRAIEAHKRTALWWEAFLHEEPPRWPSMRMPCELDGPDDIDPAGYEPVQY